MNRKTLIAGAAGALALAGTVAIAQTAQDPAQPSTDYSNQPAATAPSADTAATDTAADTTMAGERG